MNSTQNTHAIKAIVRSLMNVLSNSNQRLSGKSKYKKLLPGFRLLLVTALMGWTIGGFFTSIFSTASAQSLMWSNPYTASVGRAVRRAASWVAPNMFFMPSLLVDKQATNASPAPGATFNYNIRWRCASVTEHCLNAQITDTVPSNLQIVGTSPAIGSVTSVTQAGQTVTFNLQSPGAPAGQLSAGSTGVVSITVRFPNCGTSISNTATNTATFSAANASSVTSTVTVTANAAIPTCPTPNPPPVPGNPTITKTASSFPPMPGGLASWVIFVTTPAQPEITLEEILPAGYPLYEFSSPFGFGPSGAGSTGNDSVEVDCGSGYKQTSGALFSSLRNWWRLLPDGTNVLDASSMPSGCIVTTYNGYKTINAQKIRVTTYTTQPSRTTNSFTPYVYVPTTQQLGSVIKNTVTTTDARIPAANQMVMTDSLPTVPLMPLISYTAARKDVVTAIGGTPPAAFSSYPFNPNNNVLYNLTAQLENDSVEWVDPIIEDQFDTAQLDYLPTDPAFPNWYVLDIADIAGATGLNDPYEQTACRNPILSITTSGTTKKMRWSFPGCVLRAGNNQKLQIKVTLTVKPGVTAGTTVPNSMHFFRGDGGQLLCTDQVGGVTVRNPATDCKPYFGNASFNMPLLANMDSSKWVKGALDSSFSRYPASGDTNLNGDGIYEYYIDNTGNANHTRVELVDTLPHLNDVSVLGGMNRGSQWSEELASALTFERYDPTTATWSVVPAGELTTKYSSVYEPCRLKANGFDLTTNEALAVLPAGCTSNPWTGSASPAAGAKSFGVIWQPGSAFTPGQRFRMRVNIRQLTGEADAATGAIAWNSFAYQTTYIDSTNGNLPTEFLATEPIQVGLKMVNTNTSAALGDYVWCDTNHDGIQQGSEPPSVGVTVHLYNAAGNTLLDTTVTDSFGFYAFYGLTPSTNYIIKLDKPSDFSSGALANKTLTTANAGGDDTKDSDATLVSGFPTISATTGAGGSFNQTYDFGFFGPAALGNYVWYDNDGNGTQDMGELPVPSVGVELFYANGTTTGLTTTTDPNGLYLFSNLVPGDYYVKFTLPAGVAATHTFTNPNASGNPNTDSDALNLGSGMAITTPTNLSVGETDLSWDAGIKPKPSNPASIGDYVWEDLGAVPNGLQDPGEPGVPGIKVQLIQNGFPVATTITDSTGHYLFTDLEPNQSYSVVFCLNPSLYTLTTQDADGGGNGATDSDANPTTGETAAVTPGPGQSILTLDAGIISKLSLGNLVWLDANNNGILDFSSGVPTELGVPGLTVNLYSTLDTNTIIATTTTDANGKYLFTGLSEGSYIVEVMVPSGYVPSTDIASSSSPNNNTDSDDNGITWTVGTRKLRSAGITLGRNQEPTTEFDRTDSINGVFDPTPNYNANYTLDFGIYPLPQAGCSYAVDSSINGQTISTCDCDIFDSGGPNGDYFANENVTFTLAASTASEKIKLTFSSFNTQLNGDFLTIYDGPTTTARVIGTYSGTNSPGVVRSSGQYLTIKWTSNGGIQASGFEAHVSCITAGTIGDRVFADTNCNGVSDENSYLNSVYVELLKETAPGVFTVVDSTTTSTHNGQPGYYVFVVEQSGNYRVRFPMPGSGIGGTFSTQTPTPGVDGNSDADPTTGLSPIFAIDINGTGTAKDNLTIDAGYCSTCNAANTIGSQNILINSANNGQSFTRTGGLVEGSLGASTFGYNANENFTITIRSQMAGGRINVHPHHQYTALGAGDTLEFFDGQTTSAALLTTMTSGSGLPTNILSTGEYITIRFISDATTQGSYLLEYSAGDTMVNTCWGWTTLLRSDLIQPNSAYVISDNAEASGNVPECIIYFDANKQPTPVTVGWCLNSTMRSAAPLSGYAYGGLQFIRNTGLPADITPLQAARISWIINNAPSLGTDYNAGPIPAASVQASIWQLLGQSTGLSALTQQAIAAVPSVPPTPVLSMTSSGSATGGAPVTFTITTNVNTLNLQVSDGGTLPTLCGTNPSGTSLAGNVLTVGGSGTRSVTLCMTRNTTAIVQLAATDPSTLNTTAYDIYYSCDPGVQRFLSSRSFGSAFASAEGSWTATLYSIGNRIWMDNGAGGGTANDGMQNGTEPGISGVLVSLYADADMDGLPDNLGSPVATVTTDNSGYYRFDGVLGGKYVVRVNPSNFTGMGVLVGAVSSTGYVTTGTNQNDQKDNGIENATLATTGVLSGTLDLSTKSIPTTETDNQTPGTYGSGSTTGAESTNALTDLTVDFSFYQPPAPPECSPGKSVVTCWSSLATPASAFVTSNPNGFVMAMMDIRDPLGNGAPAAPTNWLAPATTGAYHHPSWTAQVMGEVFGTDFGGGSVSRPDVYIAASGLIPNRLVTGSTNTILTGAGGSGGDVYKADGVTGAATRLVSLPNHRYTADFGSGTIVNGQVGLGQVAWNGDNSVVYATNLDDGKIYVINPSGTVLGTFDHGASLGTPINDDTTKLYTQRNRMVFAVEWNKVEKRLYYSLYFSNLTMQIWSIAANADGTLNGATKQLEYTYNPTLPSNTVVSDIEFDATGTMMLLAELNFSYQLVTVTGSTPSGISGSQEMRVRGGNAANVYKLTKTSGTWTSPLSYLIGTFSNKANSAGGVDFGQNNYGPNPDPIACNDSVVIMGDALIEAPSFVHGIQISDINGNSSGFPGNSYFVDLNGAAGDKYLIGDVDVCQSCIPHSIGNRIWLDNGAGGGVLGDGMQNGTEPGIAGVLVSLYVDSDGNGQPDNLGAPVLTVTTDSTGYYRFDAINAGKYVVRVNPSNFTAPGVLAGFLNSSGAVTSGTNSTDQKDNGVDNANPAVNGILSGTFDLATKTIPTTETDNQTPGTYGSGSTTGTEADNAHTDLTVDFGFYPLIDLTIAKTVTSSGPYVTGSTVTYSLLATNLGPSTAQGNIIVKDLLPTGLNYVGAVGTNWTCGIAGQEITCTRAGANLAANTSAAPIIVTATVNASASGTLTNYAKVLPSATETIPESNPVGTGNGGYEDGNPATGSNNDDSKPVTIAQVADLGITKAVTPNVYPVGVATNVTYTVVVTNYGPSDVSLATVTDNQPTNVTFNTWTCAITAAGTGAVTNACGATNGTGNISTTVTLRKNAAATFTINATVGTAATGTITNTATEALPPGVTQDPNNNNPDTASIPVTPLPFSLGNRVWKDINNSGTIDAADGASPGVDGVVVRLLSSPALTQATDANGATVADQTTAGGGYYRFDNLKAGDYVVEVRSSNFTSPGVLTGCNSSGTDEANPNSDVDSNDNGTGITPGANGIRSGVATLGNGTGFLEPTGDNDPVTNPLAGEAANNQSNRTVDFGFVPAYSLGNRVWKDLNNSGTIDAADGANPGVDGVVVRLLSSPALTQATDATGVLVADQTTANGGYYRFNNLLTGDYVVEVRSSNFTSPGVLTGCNSSSTDEANPNSDVDSNDNGTGITPGANGIRSGVTTLGPGLNTEPTTDNDPATNPQAGEAPNGQSNRTVDFGFVPAYSLGNRIWKDLNNSGTIDAADGATPGVDGVVVRLLVSPALTQATDATGATVADQTTANGGYYRFNNLLSGDYVVEVRSGNFTSPGVLTGCNSSGVDESNPNSDVDSNDNGSGVTPGANGIRSGVVTLGPAVNSEPTNETDRSPSDPTEPNAMTNLTVDFGFVPAYSLGNRVWKDLNNSGTIDAADGGAPGVDGVVVRLLKSPALTQATDATGALVADQTTAGGGYYRFDNLLAGDYVVEVRTGNFTSPGVLTGCNSSGVDEANPNSDVDSNDNGTGITPGANGIRSGVVTLGPALGSEPTADNDPATNPLAGEAANNQSNRTVDFGFVPAYSLGNRVWKDLNNSGTIDAADGASPGVDGVVVRLLKSPALTQATDATGALVADQTTANGGYYRFDNLLSGDYVVEVRTGNFTSPGVLTGCNSSGTDEANPNSDVDSNDNGTGITPGANGIRSGVVTLGPALGSEPTGDNDPVTNPLVGEAANNQSNRTVDFGFVPAYSLGNRVWKDLNNSGTIDAADGANPGVDGVVVRLLVSPALTQATDATGATVADQTTANGGYYRFNNLLTGDYVVEVRSSNFTSPGALAGCVSVRTDETTPNSDVDSNDNGIGVSPGANGIRSNAVTLGPGLNTEPTGDNDPATNPQAGEAPNGQSNRTVDFGFAPIYSLGNRIWKDINNSGTIDAADGASPGVDGVVVRLLTSPGLVQATDMNGNLVADQTTANGGYYRFDNLLGGDYVVEVRSSNFTASGTLAGCISVRTDESDPNANVDSNDNGIGVAPGANGVRSNPVTLGPAPGSEPTTETDRSPSDPAEPNGSTNLTVDFGFAPIFSLGNRVWKDLDNSGTINGGELGINGVVLRLLTSPGLVQATDMNGALVPDQTTANGGYYRFDNLLGGDYVVEVRSSNFTAPGVLVGCATSTGANGQIGANGPYEPAPDADTVPADSDDNGQSAGTAVQSKPVTLGLAPGSEPTNETDRSPSDPAEPNGSTNLTVDFGFNTLMNIGNLVWKDTNGNSLRDGSPLELGIDGVKVVLWADNGNGSFSSTTDTMLAMTTTAGGGLYSFTNLYAGTYFVQIDQSNFGAGTVIGSCISSPGADTGDTDNNDNGVDNLTPTNGGVVSTPIVLVAESEPTNDGDGANGNLSIDFGFLLPSDLGFGGGNGIPGKVYEGDPCNGATGTYVLTVSNAGPLPSNPGAILTDVIPAGITPIAASGTGWSCTIVGQTVTCTSTASIAVNAITQVRITVGIGYNISGPVTNTATIAYPGDPNSSNNTASTTINVVNGLGAPGQSFENNGSSVLVYPIYTSSATNPNEQNTRINLTNTQTQKSICVHLFFVDGASCSIADSIVCLTPNQTTSFLASDLDPGATGYLVAVAIDCNGCPTNFNFLIGDEYVKFASGHKGNIAAEGVAALPGLPTCNNTSVTATLNFDGVSYGRFGRTLAVDSIGSRADGNDTMIVVDRIGGNLGTGASTLGTLFGVMYDDSEVGVSFNVAGACQLRSSLSNNFPRTTPRFETFIPAGRTGWLKLFSQSDFALVGASINYNAGASASAGAFNGAHNLHKLTLSSAGSYVIPVFPANGCQ